MGSLFKALCTMVAVGLLAACSGGSSLPVTANPNARGVGSHQSMVIPCRCSHPVLPAARRRLNP